MSRVLVPVLAASVIACEAGTSTDDASIIPPVDCPTHDDANFELGTGQLAYEPIIEEQRLPIVAGPQGGCHFFISLRTDGFAERRFKIQYEVFFAESSTTTGSRSSFTQRLRPVDGMPGICENLGITAFLIEPWELEEKRLIMEVNVVDDEGRAATQRKTVVAEWPDALPTDSCGRM
jgi:hypothetical protein